MGLAGDGHVHSEWSWDVGGPQEAAGLMRAQCGRAVEIGLPALAFTDHFDVTGWLIRPEDIGDEDEFRAALRAIARSGRALELNVGGPIRPWIPQWWAEEGGRAITFGSDAHRPDGLAGNFHEAAAMAEYVGFTPGRRPEEFWTR